MIINWEGGVQYFSEWNEDFRKFSGSQRFLWVPFFDLIHTIKNARYQISPGHPDSIREAHTMTGSGQKKGIKET